MEQTYHIPFKSKVTPIKPLNDSLTLCKCYVMALGANANNTEITEEACTAALPTLYNIPIVGHLKKDEDGNYFMGGHDVAIEKNDEGKYEFKKLTVPYGVVPQQDGVHFEKVVDDDGVERTYLCADIILWTGQYPELMNAVYKEDLYFNQSMEIKPKKTEKIGKVYKFLDYQYSALCLLGKSDDAKKNVIPCFPSAYVKPYEFEKSDEWKNLTQEFMFELQKYYSAADAEKGGNETMEMQPNEAVEPTPVVVAAEEVTPPAEVKTESEVVKFSIELTYEQKREKLFDAVKALSVWTEDLYADYWMIDFDSQYVYIQCHTGSANEAERKEVLRAAYVEGDDGMSVDMETAVPVKMCWLTKEDEDKLAADKQELEMLVEFKKQKLDEEKRTAYSNVLAEFSDLSELDEYKLITKNVMEFESKETLEEKLYALRGKFAKRPAKKSLDSIRIPVGTEEKTPKSEGQLFMEKYLARK